MSLFVARIKGFVRFKDLMGQLVSRDLKLKYRRSVLGYLWSVLNPLFIMIIMAIVFSKMFTRASITNFPVYLMSGQVMFNFMNLSTKSAIQSINGSASLLKKTYVPKYVFTVSKIISGLIDCVFSMGALLIVMLLSLPLMLLLNKIDFKRLLLGTIALFGIFQMLSAFSASYGMLMVSRIGVACTHSVFWSIASPAAVSVVSEKFRSLALSMVVTGTSIAMILGLPLGRIIGLHMGWNMAFFCVGVIAFITTAYMIFVFPKVPGGESFSIKQMPEILKNKTLMGIFLVTFLFATSYYTGYSYIEPFLQKVAGLSANLSLIHI